MNTVKLETICHMPYKPTPTTVSSARNLLDATARGCELLDEPIRRSGSWSSILQGSLEGLLKGFLKGFYKTSIRVYLQGSWDLVVGVIRKETRVIITYSPN